MKERKLGRVAFSDSIIGQVPKKSKFTVQDKNTETDLNALP